MIHIIDDWYVQPDGKQYIAGRQKTRKDDSGKIDLMRPTYHGSIGSALERIVRERKHEKVSKGTVELKEALEILSTEQRNFEAYLKTALSGE